MLTNGNDTRMETAAICAIALKESLYIEEWIAYHLKLGFDQICIYDNDPAFPLQYLPQTYPQVIVVHLPGQCQQMTAYYYFLQMFRTTHKWGAFLDIDEFVVLRKHGNIKDFLKEHCSSGAVTLNWYLFGSNHHETYTSNPVLERFTKRQNKINEHVKTITCLQDTKYMETPHYAILHNGTPHDTNGNPVTGPYNPNGTDDVACIHHYFVKSRQEFYLKCLRGRADIPQYRNYEKEFKENDWNEVEDLRAWHFFQKIPYQIGKNDILETSLYNNQTK